MHACPTHRGPNSGAPTRTAVLPQEFARMVEFSEFCSCRFVQAVQFVRPVTIGNMLDPVSKTTSGTARPLIFAGTSRLPYRLCVIGTYSSPRSSSRGNGDPFPRIAIRCFTKSRSRIRSLKNELPSDPTRVRSPLGAPCSRDPINLTLSFQKRRFAIVPLTRRRTCALIPTPE